VLDAERSLYQAEDNLVQSECSDRQSHRDLQSAGRRLGRVETDRRANALSSRVLFGPREAMVKAGAYAAQEHGDLIIERIEGSFSNVMGLPVERLQTTFEKLGIF